MQTVAGSPHGDPVVSVAEGLGDKEKTWLCTTEFCATCTLPFLKNNALKIKSGYKKVDLKKKKPNLQGRRSRMQIQPGGHRSMQFCLPYLPPICSPNFAPRTVLCVAQTCQPRTSQVLRWPVSTQLLTWPISPTPSGPWLPLLPHLLPSHITPDPPSHTDPSEPWTHCARSFSLYPFKLGITSSWKPSKTFQTWMRAPSYFPQSPALPVYDCIHSAPQQLSCLATELWEGRGGVCFVPCSVLGAWCGNGPWISAQ